jgi:hypothetical protein
VDVVPVSVVVDPVSGINAVALVLVLLMDVGTGLTVLFEGLLTAVAGAQAANAVMLMAITKL